MASEDRVESASVNQFGKEWGKQKPPVVGVVGAIDEAGDDALDLRLGLSAMQLDNLSLKRKGSPPSPGELRRQILRNTEGLTDDREYPMVTVSSGDKKVIVNVYNAFGKLSLNRGEGGPGVRISRRLAQELEAKIGSEVLIDKQQESSEIEFR